MRAKRFHSLKHPKIRQSWNKINLYNLSRQFALSQSLSHYKQKFRAKSTTRAYHGEQIRESLWEKMFSSKIRAVVPMDYRYLALKDGSEQARGRGSGLEVPLHLREENRPRLVPYMQHTFAPMERRLDTAIFRAMFASSARQARQFVIHGGVKVNGKKMIYPGYLLNPGDMFQVDPDRVLFATGAPKNAQERRASRLARKRVAKAREAETNEEADSAAADDETSSADPAAKLLKKEGLDEETADAKRKEYKTSLKDLLQNARDILSSSNDVPSAKRKQSLRAFTKTVRSAMSTANRMSVESMDAELDKLVEQLSSSSGSNRSEEPTESAAPERLSRSDREFLLKAIEEAEENPVDDTKPYATPWRPRPYMSPFAFIPRYLEVNQNICSAVYLRHPVVSPGRTEVPTPFPFVTSQLAFNWYLRRR